MFVYQAEILWNEQDPYEPHYGVQYSGLFQTAEQAEAWIAIAQAVIAPEADWDTVEDGDSVVIVGTVEYCATIRKLAVTCHMPVEGVQYHG